MEKQKKKSRRRVYDLFIDQNIGIVFVDEYGEEYAYNFYKDASGAVCDIRLEKKDNLI